MQRPFSFFNLYSQPPKIASGSRISIDLHSATAKILCPIYGIFFEEHAPGKITVQSVFRHRVNDRGK
ncbi:MAG: hypothetical protein ACJ749_20375 [Flavisolibacter sp.]